MARVRMITPKEADAETRSVYDGVLKQWGRISNFSQVLAHQPAALAGWMLPNAAVRLDNLKSDPDYVKIQQLVIIKTSALNRSAYCMSHNVPLARKIGLTEAQIKAAQGSDYMRSPDLDERQKAAIRWAEAVTDGVLRHVELFEPTMRGPARRPRGAGQADRLSGRLGEEKCPDPRPTPAAAIAERCVSR